MAMSRRMCLLGVAMTLGCRAVELPSTIHLAGDSTLADKRPEVYPETGWGQVLGQRTVSTVIVRNHAINGRSTKSFIDEGRWSKLCSELTEGDVVFIQFGHNDQNKASPERHAEAYGDYSKNLEQFVKDVRERKAEPVLLTPVARRAFEPDGSVRQTLGDYPAAMRAVAKKMEAPLVDVNALTMAWIRELGPEPSKAMFVWTPPDERHPEGRKDNTHLSEIGAKAVAGIVVETCRRMDLPFSGVFQTAGETESKEVAIRE